MSNVNLKYPPLMLVVLALSFISAQIYAAENTKIRVVLHAEKEVAFTSYIRSKVTKINKPFASSFKVGDVILEIDNTLAKASKKLAEADLEAKQAQLKFENKMVTDKVELIKATAVESAAKVQLETLKSLHKDGSISDIELEEGRRDFTAAQADRIKTEAALAPRLATAKRDVAEAQMRLIKAQKDLDGCAVIAPFAGKVVRVFVTEHEQIEPGKPLVRIVKDNILRATFLLNAKMFTRIKAGMKIKLLIDATGKNSEAIIEEVAGHFDPASRTFEVRAKVDNSKGTLRSGMNATIDMNSLWEK